VILLRVLLVSRIDDRNALEFTKKLADSLEKNGFFVMFEKSTGKSLGSCGFPLKEISADFVIVVGGDGTFLHTAQCLPPNIPLIGVNMGEVGFLAGLEPREAIPFLLSMREGFLTEKRMKIRFSRGGSWLGDALNEAVIVTRSPAKMLRFTIKIDEIEAEGFRADGIIISTPTGSTAYAMSAGGPIVDPGIEGFLLVPLAPYMLSSRPHLIAAERSLSIVLESEKTATLVIDGQNRIDLGEYDEITVTRSPNPAIFICGKKTFFEKVNDKLKRL